MLPPGRFFRGRSAVALMPLSASPGRPMRRPETHHARTIERALGIRGSIGPKSTHAPSTQRGTNGAWRERGGIHVYLGSSHPRRLIRGRRLPPERRPRNVHGAWSLLSTTFSDWYEGRAQRMGAALAYYTIFALTPGLVIVMALAGLFSARERREADHRADPRADRRAGRRRDRGDVQSARADAGRDRERARR